jgi:hypothetical protein
MWRKKKTQIRRRTKKTTKTKGKRSRIKRMTRSLFPIPPTQTKRRCLFPIPPTKTKRRRARKQRMTQRRTRKKDMWARMMQGSSYLRKRKTEHKRPRIQYRKITIWIQKRQLRKRNKMTKRQRTTNKRRTKGEWRREKKQLQIPHLQGKARKMKARLKPLTKGEARNHLCPDPIAAVVAVIEASRPHIHHERQYPGKSIVAMTDLGNHRQEEFGMTMVHRLEEVGVTMVQDQEEVDMTMVHRLEEVDVTMVQHQGEFDVTRVHHQEEHATRVHHQEEHVVTMG